MSALRPVTVRREKTGEHARRVRPLAPPTSPRVATDARIRRTSSLPKKLFLGRVIRGAGLLGVAGLAAFGVVQLGAVVERSEALPVRSVAVHGVDGARVDEVLAYAGIEVGAPLFAVDVDAVAARVLEHPFVASATVRRVAPDGVEIDVKAREARALFAGPDGLYLVDEQGRVMKSARLGDAVDLPVVTGVAAEDVAAGTAQDVLAAATKLAQAHADAGSPGGPLGEVHHVPGVGFELVLDAERGHGARVRVGDDDWSAKLARLREVLARLEAEGKQASFIYIDDDRRPERAAVRLRTEAEMRPAGGTNIPRERG